MLSRVVLRLEDSRVAAGIGTVVGTAVERDWRGASRGREMWLCRL